MLKFLLIGAALFILFKLFSGDKKHKQMDQQKETEKMAAAGDMVKDPVCGCYVKADGDIRVREGDKIHYFCSYDCRDAYLKKLEK